MDKVLAYLGNAAASNASQPFLLYYAPNAIHRHVAAEGTGRSIAAGFAVWLGGVAACNTGVAVQSMARAANVFVVCVFVGRGGGICAST